VRAYSSAPDWDGHQLVAMHESIALIAKAPLSRTEKARRLAGLIRETGEYRWVGIYDVGRAIVSILAFSGPAAPAYPEFPVAQGLTGSAIRGKKTVVAGDVGTDPRYLTAFSTTRSEIIIPVLDENTGSVIGTIDVESDEENAFSDEDRLWLEERAKAARPLWLSIG
jgi:L-methionine (R)-S-oxide reductase